MLGSGAVVVIGEQTDLLAAATNVLRFFRNESCGKCVPCRVGSHKAHAILTEALDQGADADAITPRIDELEETLRMTSICGLGQVALGPGDERAAPPAHPGAKLTAGWLPPGANSSRSRPWPKRWASFARATAAPARR